jgi:hypothetical protein
VKLALYIVGGFVALVVLVLAGLYAHSIYAVYARDQKIYLAIDPVVEHLDTATAASVAALADAPQNRPLLYAALDEAKRTQLFPPKYLDTVSQGAGQLAYWMMHSHEMDAPPEAIELLETQEREVDGKRLTFHVYKFKMPAGHWSGDAWHVGLSGPYAAGDAPYSSTAFARGGEEDDVGRVKPSELVDWYIELNR